MTEQTLHEQLKEIYASKTGEVESNIGDYRVDVVRGDLFIEIQTGSFSSIREKLRDLLKNNRVRLVYPIPYQKWIVRLNKDGKQVSRRRSPKKGRVEDIFYELVYIPEILVDPNFELEVVMVDVDEYWIDDGKGSWRRRRWSIYDRKMLKLCERTLFKSPEDLKQFIPENLSEFTSRTLSKMTSINTRLTQKMLYCLTRMNVVQRDGKKGRAYLYKLPLSDGSS